MQTPPQANGAPARTWPLVLGAIGVVFGDIGTSPLYTLKEAFGPHYGLEPDAANVLGVLSLILWSLIVVVTLKYVAILMRADNRGEGGILALTALVQRSLPVAAPLAYTVGIIGIFGTALFFGDGVITPAISVLSAVEGLEVAAPELKRYVLPITLAVLVALFSGPSPACGSRHWRCWAQWRSSSTPRCWRRPTRSGRCASSSSTAWWPGWRWARWCWRSLAARRFTPTWATSGAGPSAWPGPSSCCRRC